MRKLLAIVALLCAFALPAAAVDYPQLDGRVIDEARLLDADAPSARSKTSSPISKRMHPGSSSS